SGPALTGVLHDVTRSEEDLQVRARSYHAAWQPLKSADGAAIGSIGVVRPAAYLEGAAGAVTATIIVIGAIATLLAGGAGFMFGRGMVTRLNALTDGASRWGLGELSAPAPDRQPLLARWVPREILRDEVNELAEQLDQMRESFRQAIDRMRRR